MTMVGEIFSTCYDGGQSQLQSLVSASSRRARVSSVDATRERIEPAGPCPSADAESRTVVHCCYLGPDNQKKGNTVAEIQSCELCRTICHVQVASLYLRVRARAGKLVCS